MVPRRSLAWLPWTAALLLIFIFLSSSAQSHTNDAGQGDLRSTDSVVRWGLSNGMTVSAQSDDFEGDCDASAINYRRLINPPTSTDGFCAATDVDDAISKRFGRLSMLVQGTTHPTSQYTTPSVAHQNVTNNGNLSSLNLTWVNPVPITNYHIQVGSNNPANQPSGGSVVVGLDVYDVTYSLLHRRVIATFLCDPTSFQRTDATFALAREEVKTLLFWADMTACTFTGVQSRNLGMTVQAWSSDSLDEGSYILPELEFADYLASRHNSPGGSDGPTNYTSTNASVSYPPQSTSIVYLGVKCVDNDGRCNQVSTGAVSGWPASGECLARTWLGPARTSEPAPVSGKVGITAFRVTNTCGVPVTRGLLGFYDEPLNFLFRDHALYPGNTYSKGGGNYNFNTVPQGIWCDCVTAPTTESDTVGLVYQFAAAPFAKSASNAAFDLDANFDLTNATFASNGVFTLDGVELEANLTRGNHYGNALYLTVGAFNATGTPNICGPNLEVAVSGQDPVGVSFTRNTRGPAPATGEFGQFCIFLIEDLERSLNLGQTAGQHNTRLLGTYRFTLSGWPESALTEGGGVGYELFSITAVDGKKAQLVGCTVPLCFGNHDSTGLPMPGEIFGSQWHWETNNFDLGNQDYPNILITEGNVPFSGFTDADGRLLVNTSLADLRWDVDGVDVVHYFMNVTGLTKEQVEVIVNLTQQSQTYRGYRTVCAPSNTTGMRCFADPTANPAEVCQEFDGTTFACLSFGEGLRHIEFLCPRDLSNGQYLLNVSVFVQATSGSGFITTGGTNEACQQQDSGAIPDSSLFVYTGNVDLFNLARNGYHTMFLNQACDQGNALDTLVQDHNAVASRISSGSGSTCAIVTTPIQPPGTINHGGTIEGYQFIDIFDSQSSVPPGNITPPGGGGPPGIGPISTNLRNICTDIFGGAESDWIICGIILFMASVIGVIAVVHRYTGEVPQKGIVAAVAVPAFFGIGVLGLWPTWLLIAGSLTVVASIILIVRRGL